MGVKDGYRAPPGDPPGNPPRGSGSIGKGPPPPPQNVGHPGIPEGVCLHHHLERCDCQHTDTRYLTAMVSCVTLALLCLSIGFYIGFRYGTLACKVLVP